MSSFCGFIGKTDSETIDVMIKKIAQNCERTPICFSDGYFHLGFVPFTVNEEMQVGHNSDFTIWAMVDCGYASKQYTAKAFVEAYESKGLSFVNELDGTFAAVLWDGVQKRLYLIKDRYGAKPLFYLKQQSGFFFGSEIGVLEVCLRNESKVNMSALYQYLSFQSVYPPETVFKNISHVLPGHYGVYSDGNYEEVSYVNTNFGKRCDISYEEAVEYTESFLRNSVEACTEDGDVGILLSGGLDSSLVAAMAPKGVIKHSFCLRPWTQKGSIHQKEEDAYYGGLVAGKYGITHHVIDMTPKDLVENVEEIIKSFSQPFSGTVSGYFLFGQAAKESNRILTGDGADELFGSYRHHSVTVPLERYALMQEKGESVIGKEDNFAPYENNLLFLDSLYRYGGLNDTLWYYRLLIMGDDEKGLFLNQERFGDCIESQSTLNLCLKWDRDLKSRDVLNRSLERDFYHLLPGHTMLYQDTLARKYGINTVMPFLNNALTDYVATMPPEYKIKEGITKAVLKDMARKYLPENVVFRRKEPFTLPIAEWLLTDLKEYVTDVLCEKSVRRYDLLNADSVSYALDEFYKHPDKKSYYGVMLWNMAMLQQWAMLYM